MTTTSVSLLQRLQTNSDPASWQRLVDLYAPLLHAWLRRAAVQLPDAEDLVQEVLCVVVRELPNFRHPERPGSFRAWLRTILTHRLRDFWRARKVMPAPTGGSDFADLLNQLEDPHSTLSQLWDREHDQHVTRRVMGYVEPEFEPTTWRAFQRVVLDGAKPAEVAAELGLSLNAVWLAKSRVLRRLRQEMQGLTD